jgi:hypothetical protein
MHWVAAQFEVTLFKTQTARVQRIIVFAQRRGKSLMFSFCLYFIIL